MPGILVGLIAIVVGIAIGRDSRGLSSAWARRYLRALESKHSPQAWYIRRVGRRMPGVRTSQTDPTRLRALFRSVGWLWAAMGVVAVVVGAGHLFAG